MMNIVIDNYIPYIEGVFEQFAHVSYLSASEMTAETIRNADALIVRTRTQCNEALLKGTKVKFIASATIGYDHIDRTYCAENGIKWTNSPGCNALSVAQYMASVFVRIKEKYGWDYTQKTIGIVGVGNVGTQIARLSEVLGMRVLLNDPPRAKREGQSNFTDLDTLCKEADIISFHTWLDRETEDKTYHLADDDFFNKLEKKPILINSSRGEVVCTAALKQALETSQIEDAILDCWENEPHIDTTLLRRCFITTPHIAGYSADGKANATMQSVRAISRFFGLGIDDWKPTNLPIPKQKDDKFDSIGDFFIKTYDISEDSEQLKSNPQKFEYFRSHYPFRREPKAYPNFLPKELCQEFWEKFHFFQNEP